MNGHLIMRVLAGTGLLLTILCVQPWRPGMRVAAQMIPNQVGSQSGGIFGSDPLDDPRIRAHQRKTLNEQRQKELLSDTQKLLQATRELHNEMISQSFTRPTPLQVEKLIRIEKLAKKVRENMSWEAGDPAPSFRDPLYRADQ